MFLSMELKEFLKIASKRERADVAAACNDSVSYLYQIAGQHRYASPLMATQIDLGLYVRNAFVEVVIQRAVIQIGIRVVTAAVEIEQHRKSILPAQRQATSGHPIACPLRQPQGAIRDYSIPSCSSSFDAPE